MDIEIEVEDRRDEDKRRGIKRELKPDARLMYIVRHNGEEIGRWIDPECTAARWLVERGRASREDQLVTFRPGRVKSLTGKVGWFADHRVEETETIGPRFTRWRPFPSLRGRAGTASEEISDAE